MSYWIELHCDTIEKPLSYHGNCVCYSETGNSPGIMVGVASDITSELKNLKKRSLARGWQFRAGLWACPVCAKAQSTPGRVSDELDS